MNHYRITIEPISDQAREKTEAMQIEAAGFILGAEEDLSQQHVTLPDGNVAGSRAHIHVNGTGVSRVLLHMIDNLPEKLIEDLAIDILRMKESLRPIMGDDFVQRFPWDNPHATEAPADSNTLDYADNHTA